MITPLSFLWIFGGAILVQFDEKNCAFAISFQ